MSYANPQNHHRTDDEISLVDLLEILWNKKLWIIGVTALAFALSLGSVMLMKRPWQSTTDILILTPSGSVAPHLSSEALLQIASSTELLGELLDKVPQGSNDTISPVDYKQHNFSNKLRNAGPPVHFTTTFKAETQEVSLQSAIQWPLLLEARLKKIYSDMGTATLTKTNQAYERAWKIQKDTEQALQDLLKNTPLEQMARKLSELENRYHTMQKDLDDATTEFHDISAQLPPLEKALADLPAQTEHPSGRVNIEVSTTTPLGQSLQEQIIQLKVQQALKTNQKKRFEEELNSITATMNQLRIDLQKTTLENARLKSDLDIQQEQTKRLKAELQTAQLFASTENFDSLVRVIVAPELPMRSVVPARRRTVVLATLAGAFLGILGAFLSHAIDERRTKNA